MHQARARFVAERNHSDATTTATHITCTNTNGASTHSHTHGAMSYTGTTGRTSCGTPERHRTSSPEGEAWAALS